jgi:hypothetical protein
MSNDSPASELKLTKGSLKVILTDAYAITENIKRLHAGGQRFIPPFIVLEHHADQKTTDTHLAFEVIGKVRARYDLKKFPFPWSVTKYRDYRTWLETTGDLTLITSIP